MQKANKCDYSRLVKQQQILVDLNTSKTGTCLDTCETAHASSGFSKRSNENSIKTLHAAATDSS